MSDDGYTLVEALAAMLIVGLAMSGLTAGVQIIARKQVRVTALSRDTEALRAARAALEELLELDGGPYRAHEPQAFRGDARGFTLACGQPEPCAAALVEQGGETRLKVAVGGRARTFRIPAQGRLAFRYRGAYEAGPAWPPARPERQALRTVAVIREAGTDPIPYVSARVWTAQPVACQYDAILEDCR